MFYNIGSGLAAVKRFIATLNFLLTTIQMYDFLLTMNTVHLVALSI